MKNDGEKKSFLERLLVGKNQGKNNSCCSFDIVELPDEVINEEAKEINSKDTSGPKE